MSLDRYQQPEKPSYPFPTWPRRARIEDHRKDCHGHLRAPELPDEQGALLVIVTDTERVVLHAISGDSKRVRVVALKLPEARP